MKVYILSAEDFASGSQSYAATNCFEDMSTASTRMMLKDIYFDFI